jgi:hypothetical protein
LAGCLDDRSQSSEFGGRSRRATNQTSALSLVNPTTQPPIYFLCRTAHRRQVTHCALSHLLDPAVIVVVVVVHTGGFLRFQQMNEALNVLCNLSTAPARELLPSQCGISRTCLFVVFFEVRSPHNLVRAAGAQ